MSEPYFLSLPYIEFVISECCSGTSVLRNFILVSLGVLTEFIGESLFTTFASSA